MKGQSSIEFLVIVGIALVLSAPFVISAQDSLIDLSQSSETVEFEASLSSMKDAVNSVNSMGEPAKKEFTLEVPVEIENMTIDSDQKTVVYTVNRLNRSFNHTKTFDTEISGNFPEERGIYEGTVKARENYAEIDFEG